MSNRTVFFGELLIRLAAPARELLLQSPRLDLHIGGAEANVAVGLAHLGHETAVVSTVPDNALGRGAVSAIRAHGVDCRAVRLVGSGRMGLYFLAPGAGLRASEIIYDRADSSFANAKTDAYQWDSLLANAGRLHLSGITPALGPVSAQAALDAAKAAQRLGIAVSFDGNYRAKLWESWASDPKTVLRELIGYADILFGNHRDISLVLGEQFSGDGADRQRQAAQAAFASFPKLKLIASTSRHMVDADCHRICARIDAPTQFAQTEDMLVSGIVDRIGAGDAFAAGVLHALAGSGDGDLMAMARTGLALTCLKHSLPGDASLFDQKDIDAFNSGEFDVRR